MWQPIETLFQEIFHPSRVLVTDGEWVTSTFIGYPDFVNPVFFVDDLDEYEQELSFQPTHWMPLPEPPSKE